MNLIDDEDLIDSKFGVISPFLLKKDLISIFGKDYTLQQKQKIFRDIPLLIANGYSKNNTRMKLGLDHPHIFCVKLRCKDERKQKGKSAGLRVLVLVDKIRNVLIPLHIYAKSDKTDITRFEEQELKKFVSIYSLS